MFLNSVLLVCPPLLFSLFQKVVRSERDRNIMDREEPIQKEDRELLEKPPDRVHPPPSRSNPNIPDFPNTHHTGFPILTCPIEEYQEPSGGIGGTPGRIAWSAELSGSPDEKVSVYHAWLVEDLEGDRVRILTQESQRGKPAAEYVPSIPHPFLCLCLIPYSPLCSINLSS